MANINGKKIEIHLKGGFSERKGIKHFSDIVQVNSLNERTRNRIYTATKETFDLMEHYDRRYKDFFVNLIYEDIFSLTKRDIPLTYSGTYFYSEVFDNIYDIFIKENYEEVFTFIEGIIKCFGLVDESMGFHLNLKNNYIQFIRAIFNNENVNYRIINDTITDIVDKETIKEIEETLNNPYDIVKKHYNKAIEKLYQDKDFDNSIKESISSVEAMCQIVTGDNKATLGDALKILKNDIHPAMKSAFEKLYGYTSDANGIRHSNGLGEGNSTFEEAKYMLISCSAFVNYLRENFENKEE